jgi:ABC-type phosphate transport system substrate-binding protein
MIRRLHALAFAAALAALPALATGAGAERLRLVVHPSVPVRTLPREAVARLFLGKAQEWSDGTRVRPVDQRDRSAIREAFAREVLRRSTAAVKAHWQQLVFSGRGVPPPEAPSDAAVLAHVRAHPGAIGYVSASAPLDGVAELDLER